jgi:hypothetical protein
MPNAYVWALANPADLKEAEREIAGVVRQALGTNDPGRHGVDVSESSGWIGYFDRAQLWQKRTALLPPRAADARRIAEEFLRRLGTAARAVPALQGVAFLPPRLEPTEVVLVPHPQETGWDHWLYRAQPLLRLDDRKDAAILGAQIEVRIGDYGQVISYRARYSPITAERVTTELVPFDPEMVDEEHHGEHREEPERPVVYMQDGDAIPQYYVAPYYLVNDGHSLRLSSASEWSLVVEFGVTQEEEATRVTAVVAGGSGDYAFDWGMYPIDTFEEGYRGLGSGSRDERTDHAGRSITTSSVSIPIGASVVLVNVRDQQTGAFKHHQQSVFSSPFASDRATAPREARR